ncbi:MAG TPA: glycosyltransferase [Solirubrobacterales bacterium]|nr:glycosyltransferase [Solirubrobacterales bacterium]
MKPNRQSGLGSGAVELLGGGPRRLVERAAARRVLRRRRPPELRTSGAARGSTVYYLCPDHPHPSGGIRALYKHVDILNAAGIDAAVLHHEDGFSCSWFEHSTRVVGASSVVLSDRDTLVVPEVYGPFLDRLPRLPHLVLFNQNAYLTWEHLRTTTPRYDIFERAMTVSADSAEILAFAFPGLDVGVVPNAIDPAVFHPARGPVGRRIATMPRKRPDDLVLIERLLGERLRGWELVKIEGASEREAAARMRAAPIFLSLARREGFGLPAAEAMASGAYVVGFHGFGGREIFDPDCSEAVEDGDVLAAARALAAAMDRFEAAPAGLRAAGERAAARVRERYGPARRQAELLAFHGAGEPAGARIASGRR